MAKKSQEGGSGGFTRRARYLFRVLCFQELCSLYTAVALTAPRIRDLKYTFNWIIWILYNYFQMVKSNKTAGEPFTDASFGGYQRVRAR